MTITRWIWHEWKMQENNTHKHFKTWMQQDIMKLHEILRKFHIWHVQNGATVQPQSPIQF